MGHPFDRHNFLIIHALTSEAGDRDNALWASDTNDPLFFTTMVENPKREKLQ